MLRFICFFFSFSWMYNMDKRKFSNGICENQQATDNDKPVKQKKFSQEDLQLEAATNENYAFVSDDRPQQ